mmetsp:Transcript_81870/g.187354  ORF Transcript_81870/g.187354 Transcript_81870/m.187354 type:complete len:201 (-) Transcript_81870:267-869(-)
MKDLSKDQQHPAVENRRIVLGGQESHQQPDMAPEPHLLQQIELSQPPVPGPEVVLERDLRHQHNQRQEGAGFVRHGGEDAHRLEDRFAYHHHGLPVGPAVMVSVDQESVGLPPVVAAHAALVEGGHQQDGHQEGPNEHACGGNNQIHVMVPLPALHVRVHPQQGGVKPLVLVQGDTVEHGQELLGTGRLEEPGDAQDAAY